MNIDSIKEYIIPIGLLLLYFFVSAGKKGKKKPSQASAPVEQEEEERPVMRREIPAKAVEPSRESLSSRFKDKPVPSTVAARELDAAVKADFSGTVVSQEMQKYSQNDAPVIPAPQRHPSRASRLFRQKGSLRQAILLKEILSRPFE